MFDKKPNRIVFLDYLRVIAIFMVIVIHSTEPFYLGGEGTLVRSYSDARWVTLVEVLCRACVPLFVMASAYLLFPTRQTTGAFLKRRLLRVGVPFALWCAIYTAWNHGDWGRLAFNFPMSAGGHLWFVPMLLGLYLVMPLLSPWAEKVSERELWGWIGLCLFTMLLPCLRVLFGAVYGSGWGHLFGEADFDSIPFLWGECGWNSFGAFQYVSGFLGYVLLGFYFRKFSSAWSARKTLAIAAPVGVCGALAVGLPFLAKIARAAKGVWPLGESYPFAVELETPIEYCSLGVAALVFAWFVVIRLLSHEGRFYAKVVRPLSEASYGTYLSHMLILTPVSEFAMPRLATPMAILATAAVTFLAASVVSLVLKRIPRLGSFLA